MDAKEKNVTREKWLVWLDPAINDTVAIRKQDVTDKLTGFLNKNYIKVHEVIATDRWHAQNAAISLGHYKSGPRTPLDSGKVRVDKPQAVRRKSRRP